MKSAVFFDRDGVINQVNRDANLPYPPKCIEDLKIIDGVEELIKLLREAKYLSIIITNQPDVARKKTDKKIVEGINKKIINLLPIDAIYTCYHDNEDNCECRKPKAGSILKAAKEYNIDLKSSYMIGDRWKDIAAGETAGCKTIYIDYKYNEKQPKNYDFKINSIKDIERIILN